MIKEIKEEIRFIMKHLLFTVLVLGILSGIIPCAICGGLLHILGF